MAQSRKRSWNEAIASTATGFILSSVITIGYYWMLKINVPTSHSFALVGILTVVSVLRQYVWRRIFNRGEK